MWQKLLATRGGLSLAIVRLVLGLVMFPHGAQKLLGWFGGYGFSGTMGAFTHQMGIPAPLAFLAICAEFFGGLGLIAGFLSRIAAFGVLCTMTVAVLTAHLHNGFFMNWAGTNKGEGFEYHLLAIAMALAVMIGGAGAPSVDRALSRSGPAAD
ncbi:MAG: DoxX family protein [Bryobacteraceae bacterium]